MSEIIRFTKEDTILVIIDMQERLLPAMCERERTEDHTLRLVRGLNVLGVPKLVTTQYARGLGQTVETLAAELADCPVFDKTAFSAYKDEAFRAALEKTGRKTVILSGVEAHVCVLQTALDLIEHGYRVALAMDCVSSRAAESVRIAEKTLMASGAVLTSCESILFELLGSAKAPEFKQISAIVK